MSNATMTTILTLVLAASGCGGLEQGGEDLAGKGDAYSGERELFYYCSADEHVFCEEACYNQLRHCGMNDEVNCTWTPTESDCRVWKVDKNTKVEAGYPTVSCCTEGSGRQCCSKYLNDEGRPFGCRC